MKTFLLLLIALILHFSAVSSEHLEVLIRPADFGFSERDNIILMEELSKDEIVFLVHSAEEGNDKYHPWVYKISTREYVDIGFGADSDSVFFLLPSEYLNGMEIFRKQFKKIGQTVYYSVQFGHGRKEFVAAYAMDDRQLNVLPNNDSCMALKWEYLDVDEGPYFIRTTECARQQLYTIRSGTLVKLADIGASMSEGEYIASAAEVFVHNSKIYLYDSRSVYAYDVPADSLESIIPDYSRFDQSTTDSVSIPHSFIIRRDKVYVHVSDYAVLYDIWPWFLKRTSYLGSGRLWETDGTPEGTSLYHAISIPVENKEYYKTSYGKVLNINEELYVTGEANVRGEVPLYRASGVLSEWIGDIAVAETSNVDEIYSLPYTIGEFSQISRDNMPVSGKYRINGKDYVPIFGYKGLEPGKDELRLTLFTVDQGRISYHLQKFLVNQGLETLSDKQRYLTNFLKLMPLSDEKWLIQQSNFLVDSFTLPHSDMIFSLMELDVKSKDIKVKDRIIVKELPVVSPFTLDMLYMKGGFPYFIYNDPGTKRQVIWAATVDQPTHILPDGAVSGLFRLYPNPAGSFVKLQSERELDGILQVIGIDGRIHRTSVIKDTGMQLDLQGVPPGWYTVIYHGERETSAQPVIIAR